jgi:hypothetical protein
MRTNWPGFNNTGNVIIQLASDAVKLDNNGIIVAGETFTPKDELHITIIGSTLGDHILQKLRQLNQSDRLLQETFENFDWSYETTGPVHMLSRRTGVEYQKSVILLVDMPAMTDFYNALKSIDLITEATPVPPAHITMYTRNCPVGIGVPNPDVLETLTVESMTLDEFESQYY